MLILKGAMLGVALFFIGAVIYMFLGGFLTRHKLVRIRGVGIISSNSHFLWMAFLGSLVVGWFISIRSLWILQGAFLGGAIFIVGTLAYWIAYNRHFQKLHPHPPGIQVGISVRHLRLKLFVALISSVALGLAVMAAAR